MTSPTPAQPKPTTTPANPGSSNSNKISMPGWSQIWGSAEDYELPNRYKYDKNPKATDKPIGLGGAAGDKKADAYVMNLLNSSALKNVSTTKPKTAAQIKAENDKVLNLVNSSALTNVQTNTKTAAQIKAENEKVLNLLNSSQQANVKPPLNVANPTDARLPNGAKAPYSTPKTATSKGTLSVGVTANATAFVGASISIGVSFDLQGNIVPQWSYSYPSDETKHIGFLDAGASVYLSVTDAKTVYDLEKDSSQVGGSGGFLGYGGIDIISFSKPADHDSEINGVQISVGIGIGGDIHIVSPVTKTIK